ncbi:hypothetical protein, partial [Archangium lipolyticum]|uniref:hypothetical protein n=1 Tax=Archangium lipolyticum TaxID=2970465 RepID=UPI00214A71AF
LGGPPRPCFCYTTSAVPLSSTTSPVTSPLPPHQPSLGGERLPLKNSHGARHKQEAIRKEEKFASIAKDEYLTLKARLDTLPSADGSFLDYLKIYDAQLLEDARAIQSLAKYLGRHKLRPHYKALLEAYEAEKRGQGLRDMGIIQFFDTYVHDSLAAFVKDSTLPSDPRVIYIGGDDKLRYAVNQPLGQGFPTSAVG